jgi:hypothetical protein
MIERIVTARYRLRRTGTPQTGSIVMSATSNAVSTLQRLSPGAGSRDRLSLGARNPVETETCSPYLRRPLRTVEEIQRQRGDRDAIDHQEPLR